MRAEQLGFHKENADAMANLTHYRNMIIIPKSSTIRYTDYLIKELMTV